ncbi:MAG: hypothetical protein COA79_13205 [Planctomycetota bacterium]|nr:MAG: hypothetical protein COA79_13205 [Planctomycetota bacterium]
MLQIALQSIKYLFKNKLLTLLIILFPLICSAGLSFGLQASLLPSIKNLIENKGKDQVESISKYAKELALEFKTNNPKMHKELKINLEDKFIKKDTHKVAQTIAFQFSQTLIPTYHQLVGRKLAKIMQRTNSIVLILLSISILPALISVFLISQEKQTGTLEAVLAQGVSSQKFLLGKIVAALLINLLILSIIIIGYALGSYLSTSDPIYFQVVFNKITIQSILTIGITGSLATLSFMFLICTLITEFKTQIFIAFLVPFISIGSFFALTSLELGHSSLDDLNQSTQKIKAKRPTLTKDQSGYRSEKQMYLQTSMKAKMIAEREIPDIILSFAFTEGFKARSLIKTKIMTLNNQIRTLKRKNNSGGRNPDYAKNEKRMEEIAVLIQKKEELSKRVIREDPKAKSFIEIIQSAALCFFIAALAFISATLLFSFRIRI